MLTLTTEADCLFSNPRNIMRTNILNLVGVILFFRLSIYHAARRCEMYHSSETVPSLRLPATKSGDDERVLVQETPIIPAIWLSENKLPEEVLRMMPFDSQVGSVEDLVRHPNFNVWLNYVKNFRDENPTTKGTPSSILVKLFTFEKVSAAMKELKGYRNLKSDWRAYLKFGEQSKLQQSLYDVDFCRWWAKYTYKFNTGIPSDKQISIIDLMRMHLSDREILAKVTIVVKDGPDVDKPLASAIRQRIIGDWIRSKKSPDDVFAELKITPDIDRSPFERPLYRVWIDYLDAFNKEWTESAITNVKVFLEHFTLDQIAEMIFLAEASNSPIGIEAGQRFKFQLLDHWFSHNKLPDQLFNELQKERSGLDLWIAYLSYYSAQLGNGNKWLESVVERNPENIITILQAAWNSEKFRSVAYKLLVTEGERVSREKNMSPQEVFERFELNRTGKKLLLNPLFEQWLDYTMRFQHDHPNVGTASWLDILNMSYDKAQICDMIKIGLENPRLKSRAQWVEDAVIKLWLHWKTYPKKLFVDLKLHKVNDPDFVARPTFMIWDKYVGKFYGGHANAMIEMIKIMKGYIRKGVILNGLRDAARNPDTKDLATKLLKVVRLMEAQRSY